jgi:hypothetical protein
LEVQEDGNILVDLNNIKKYEKGECIAGLDKCIQMFGCQTKTGVKLGKRLIRPLISR